MNKLKRAKIKEFGEQMKLVRKTHNLTLNQVAIALKLKSTSRLSMMESGASPITAKELKLFCHLFNLPYEQLRDKIAIIKYED